MIEGFDVGLRKRSWLGEDFCDKTVLRDKICWRESILISKKNVVCENDLTHYGCHHSRIKV